MNKIVVTGAAGFIGSNIVQGLNARGISDIIAVDDLRQGDKFRNLADLHIADYVDATDFYGKFAQGHYGKVEAVFHEGACSDTMEQDGQYMMRNNFTLSCELLAACQAQGTRLLYASSAATYGDAKRDAAQPFGYVPFSERAEYEGPLNVYGYSKLLFDQKLRRDFGQSFERASTQVAGFRYFNVYGPREQHKGRMASVAYHQFHQFKKEGKVRLFGAYGGFGPGQQMRDFVSVDDVVAVNLWFFDHPEKHGLFNLGSGQAQAFDDVAQAVVTALQADAPKTIAANDHSTLAWRSFIEYFEFPHALRGKYQCFTQANLSALRAAGCEHAFADVGTGVARYMAWLKSQPV